jgi:regulatory protein
MALVRLERKLCLEQAIRYLAFRAHFAAELNRKLETKGFSPSICQAIIEECRKLGYIDDLEQTRSLIRREQRKGNGPQLILQKLKMQGGIPNEGLNRLKQEMEAAQIEGIQTYLHKRCRNIDWKDQKQRRKVMAALQRRGFQSEAICREISKRAVGNN